MARRVRTVLAGGAAVCAALVLAAGALLAFSERGRELQREVALRELGRAVDGTVRLGALRVVSWRTVEARDVAFEDRDGRPVLGAVLVRASFAPLDLVRGRLVFRGVELFRPAVDLRQGADGRWNVARLFRSSPDTARARRRPLVDLRDVRVTAGALSVQPTGRARPLRFVGVNLDLRRLRASHPDSAAVIAEVRNVSLRLEDPAVRVRRGYGHVVVDRDSVAVRFDVLELPGSVLSLRALVRGGPSPTYAFSANAERFRFEDIAWLSPKLPRDGGGTMVLRGARAADGTGSWDIRDADVSTGESRVRGRVLLGVGGSRGTVIEAMDVTASPLDLAVVAPWLGALPLRGLVAGHASGSGALAALDVDANLTFTDAAVPGRPMSTVIGRGRLALGGSGQVAFHRFALGRADLSLATVERIAPAVNLHGRLALSGTLDGPWRAAGFTGTLAHADGDGPTSTARGTARLVLGDTVFLSAELNADSLSFDDLARTYVGLPLHGAVAGRVRVVGPVTALELSADLTGPAGHVVASGVVGAHDSVVSLRLEGRFDGVDLAPHFDWSPPTVLAGTFATHLLVPTADSLAPTTGTVRATLDRPRVAGVTFLRAGLALGLGGDAIRIDTLFAEHSSGRFDAVGAFGRPGAPPARVSFGAGVDTLANFAPLARWWRERSGLAAEGDVGLEGEGRFTGTLSGTTDAWDVRADLSLATFAFASVRARALRVEGTFAPGGAVATVKVTVDAESLAVAEFRTGELHVTAQGRLDSVAIRADVALPLNASLRTALFAALDSARLRARIEVARLRLPSGVWALAGPATVLVTPDSAVVAGVDLRSGAGRLRADGTLPVRGVGDLRLVADSVPVADVYALAQRDTTGIGGWVSASARVAGAAASPTMEAYVSLADGRFGDFRTPLVDGLFHYGDHLLTFKGALWRDTTRVLGVRGALPLDLSLTSVEHRRLPGPVEFFIRADSADLSAVDAVTTLVGNVRGALTADVGVRGTWNQPVLSGTATVANGALTLPSLGQRWQGIEMRLAATGDSIHLLAARVRSGGTLDIGGAVVLEDLTRPVLHLTLEARGFQALNKRDFAGLTGTGTLQLRGPLLGATLTGALTVDEGFLAFADLVEKRIVNLDDPEFRAVVDTSLARAAVVGPSAQNVFLDSLRIDALRLTMGPSVWLRSSEANIQLNGDFTVSKSVEGALNPYRLDGTLRAVRGTYRLTIGPTSKDFQVTRGEVRFFGTPDLDPQLDIAAEHAVRAVRGTELLVRARLGGTLLAPRLALESDQRPPLSETEIVSYLLFGRPSFDLLGGAPGTGSEQAVLQGAIAGLAGIAAGQLEQTLVADLGLPLDYIAIRPGTAGDVLGTMRVEAGAQIGERTFLTLAAPLCEVRRGISSQLLGATLAYQLAGRWRLQVSIEPLLQECRALGVAPRPSAPYQIGLDLFWQRGIQ
jgi:translocation and assembly module TamB